MRLNISAVALGLIVSVSCGTATPSDDASRPTRTSTGYQQQYDQSDPIWHEPPAWAAARDNDNDGAIRRLESTCPFDPSPYDSTTIMAKIGAGSPGLGPDGLDSCVAPGGRYLTGGPDDVGGSSDGRYLMGMGGGDDSCDPCFFPECGPNGFNKFANATGLTDNMDGTYTYSFNITGGAMPAISHSE